MSGECNVCVHLPAEINHCAFKDIIDELRADNAQLEVYLNSERDENRKLQAENKRLKEALKEYGRS